MLKLPMPLDKDLKQRCIERLDELCVEMGHHEVRVLLEKLPKVYKRLTKNDGDWLYRVGVLAKVMLLNTKIIDKNSLTEEGRIVVGALYYLVDPMDIIPDHDPERGYFDDAIVLNESLKRLKKVNRPLVLKIEEEYTKVIDGYS